MKQEKFKICSVCGDKFSLYNKRKSAMTCGYSCGSKLKFINRPDLKEMTANMGRKQIKIINETGLRRKNYRHTDETKRKISDKLYGVPKSPEAVAKQKISYQKSVQENPHLFGHPKRYKTGYIINRFTSLNEWYSSGLEKCIMEELNCNSNIQFWTKRHGISIKYEYKGKQCIYLPDFFIKFKSGRTQILEAKGRIYDQDQIDKKTSAGKQYCDEQGYEYKLFYQTGKNCKLNLND